VRLRLSVLFGSEGILLMSRIAELQTKLRVLRWCGLSPGDFIAAMHVIECSDEIPDKRVLGCRVAHPGDVLLVTTGEGRGGCFGGGCTVLLERAVSGWVIAEVEGWRS
jgi:hypothetical protein